MKNNPYRLIVSLNLDRHEILVVGGGVVGERKIGTLLESGARVRLISPDATENLANMAMKGVIAWEARAVRRDDFRARSFAVLALPRDALAGAASMARMENCVIDACSDGASGDFALCAQFEMDGCYIGVSSGGTDPAKAAAMKRVISRCDAVVLTRNSPLALNQAGVWIEALAGVGVKAARRTVTSHGDRDRKRDLAEFGGFGAFVKALEEELLAGRGDFAVHSMKDMPVNLPEGCVVAATLPRESSYDVLITRDGKSLESLPPGAVIGTSSLRRKAQVRCARRDLVCVSCRGNIETRLRRLDRGEVDAVILAEAGLNRLGLDAAGARRLPFITAAGQGAIAIEAIAGSEMERIARELNHFETWCEAVAERELLRLMGLGCACPIGVRGTKNGGTMTLEAVIYSIDMKGDPVEEMAAAEASGTVESDVDAKALASRLWEDMRDLPLMLELSASGGSLSWA